MAVYIQSKEEHTHEIRIGKNIEIVSFVCFSLGCLSSLPYFHFLFLYALEVISYQISSNFKV